MADQEKQAGTQAPEEGATKKAQEFVPIESQEALDAILTKRLERQKASYETKLAEKEEEIAKLTEAAGQTSDAEARLEELKAEMEALQSAQAISEQKTKIAEEFQVPQNLIFGDSEDEMRQVAEELKKLATPDAAPALSNAGHFAQENTKEDSRLALAKQLLGE